MYRYDYQKLRKLGWMAKDAMRAHRAQQEFDFYESSGILRLKLKLDELFDFEDLCGDCFNPKVTGGSKERMERERKEFAEKCNQDGVWGLVAEVRESEANEWKNADSCWGFVGEDDPFLSGYGVDIMLEGIDAAKRLVAGRRLLATR